ncbi:lysophospholipid acyltransferase family protein [Rathayibacter sp. YIM 133350]|uniref:lysophospholipid acyltransferase family protein n=1 Tax=Rathayibacter sp. YIM 133350 TaxID=3131992 RepID=UPI00307FA8E2
MVDESPAPSAAVPRPGFLYAFCKALLWPLVMLYFRPRILGRRNVPRSGPVIFASNHLSFIDSIAIPIGAPRRLQFMAKSVYFEGTGVKGSVIRWFFRSIGVVPVERGAGAAGQESLEIGTRILASGGAFALYPEGTRSLDGRLYKGRTGVAFLALSTGATVVPVGLRGTERIQPVGTNVPRPRRFTVAFGEPLDLSVHGPATSGRARRHATDDIMAAIHALSGQELADAYNEVPPSGVARLVDRVLPRERR